ncbi:MAG: flagellar biosynthetic protein FliO [Rhodocyclaceae bacterium]|jgi:flagellar protein FliO/FliZ|nr:flagellar biosynthetic protein FliO [Rhodocyclaceae bacterium]
MHFPARLLSVASALAAPAALAQSSAAATPEIGSSLLQVIPGLGVVIALLVGALWLLKRLSAPRGTAAGLLRVVAGTAVGPRERVVLVEVGDTWLVVGVAPGQVNALHQLPKQDIAAAPAAGGPAGKNFGAWLKQTMERRNAR